MSLQVDLTQTMDCLSLDSQGPSQPALTEFLLFPKLPTEIRLKIWHIILYAHRRIILEHLVKKELPPQKPATGTEETANWETNERRIHGVIRVEEDDNPAVLMEINMESRMEAQNFYEGRMPSHNFTGWEIIRGVEAQAFWGSGKLIPVSFPNTTFSLLTRHFLTLKSPLLQQIQKMELLVTDHAYFAFFTMDTLKLMSSLRNLRLNVRKGELNAWSDAIRGGWWRQLIKDFEDEKLKDLEWECPHVQIFDDLTGAKIEDEVKAGKGEAVDQAAIAAAAVAAIDAATLESDDEENGVLVGW